MLLCCTWLSLYCYIQHNVQPYPYQCQSAGWWFPTMWKKWCFNWSSSERVNREEEVKNLNLQIKKDRSNPAEKLDWNTLPPTHKKRQLLQNTHNLISRCFNNKNTSSYFYIFNQLASNLWQGWPTKHLYKISLSFNHLMHFMIPKVSLVY